MEPSLLPKLLPSPIYAVVSLAILLLDGGKSLHSFFDLGGPGEGGKPEIALSCWPEACAGRANDICFLQQPVEEVP